VLGDETLFSIPCEGVFNAHSAVYRTALVGAELAGTKRPVLCVELEPGATIGWSTLVEELKALGQAHKHTKGISTFLKHESFPVDIRHNAKIGREKLTVWATGQVK
jgi:hypothetical protein